MSKANKRAKGQLRVAVIIPVSLMRHWIKYQHVSMDESAAPFRPAGGRAAVCPGSDSVSRTGPQGPRPENSKTYVPAPLNCLLVHDCYGIGGWAEATTNPETALPSPFEV